MRLKGIKKKKKSVVMVSISIIGLLVVTVSSRNLFLFVLKVFQI